MPGNSTHWSGIWRASVLVLLLLVIAGYWSLYHSGSQGLPHKLQAPLPIPNGQGYSTNFPVTETPLSESGKWIDGKVGGLDWTSIKAVGGLVYGTESGTGKDDQSYDDSTALLAGNWGPDQTVEARVYSANPRDDVFEEVELRLRSSLSAHTSTGYEVLFRCLRTPKAYASIVRWDGSVGKFTYLAQEFGLQCGVGDGDLIKAAIVGNVITGYINGVQVLRATDSTFPSGSPGIGFWMKRHSGIRAWFRNRASNNADYGFTSVAAWY